MIDPLTTLAVAMGAKKGAYALLLGSGISRAAQIPTGWDIVLDLVRSIARLEGADCGDDPAGWYRGTHGEAPEYGVLLGRVARTPAERSQVVRGYIEPSPEERDLGLKLPTDAHRAIAELVAGGYIRVVVTTNFDRLLESALGDVGVVPTVVDSADGARGALPFVHNPCTVLKLHGDYVDGRIKNTVEELARYPGPINRLLDQVLTEYGLIVCGWSGEWDAALVEALRRRRSPWFATYWVSYRGPGPTAQALIERREAAVLTNLDADAFFRRLADGVAALEDLAAPELISAAMARAAVKRYIDDPSRRIRLHDLVVGEANRVRRAIEEEPLASYNLGFTQAELAGRLRRYEGQTEVLRTLLATGCYWGEAAHERHWVACLERLTNPPKVEGRHSVDWINLRRFPALLALYTGGMAAVARGRYETLAGLLVQATAIHYETGDRLPLVLKVNTSLLTEYAAEILSPGTIRQVVLPLHLWNNQQLWAPLREYVPDEDQFQACFDRFEYLVGPVTADLRVLQGYRPWGPLGFFAWRRYGLGAEELINGISAEINEQGATWPPLRAGLFGGSQERLAAARQAYDALALQARYQ